MITVVDAKHGQKQLDEHDEARAQVGFADRILLSKTDLVAESEVADLMGRLRDMNPRAHQKKVHFGETDIREILDIRGFNLNAALEIDPAFLDDGHHHHDDDVKSFVWKDPRPLHMEKIETFLSLMVQNYGEDLLRYKGDPQHPGRAAAHDLPGRAHADGRHPRQALGPGRGPRERDGVHRPAHPAPALRGRPGVLRGMSAAASPMLEIRDLRHDYAGRTVLAVPAWDVARGEASLVLGPSGSGKTTLLNVIAGLATPTAGTVRVAGADVTRLAPAQRDAFRARNVGLVLQTLHLIGVVSVRENLRLAQHLAGARDRRPRASTRCSRASGSRASPGPARATSPSARRSAWPSRAPS